MLKPPWPARLAFFAILAVTLAIALFRATLVEQRLGWEIGQGTMFFRESLTSDSWLVGAVAVLGAFAFLLRGRVARAVIALSALGLVALTAVDVVVFKTLSYRLYFSDLRKFGTEFSAIGDFISIQSNGAWLVMLVGVLVFGVLTIIAATVGRERQPKVAVFMALFAAVLVLVANSFSDARFRFVHDAELRNWVVNNLDGGVDTPYGADFIKSAEAGTTKTTAMSCIAGEGGRSDIILLVVESLSAYHSHLMGGVGWTPELDRIAEKNTWFANFHANGFTTDHGLIALLAGRVPLPSVGRYGSSKAYEGFESAEGAVPTRMHQQGYESLFFTTGDLGFLDKGDWCQKIGFGHVEGAEQPFYSNWPRFHFNAAPDQALFERFINWYGTRDGKGKPFFATLLTVSSHAPYLDPETHTRSEEAAIRYADRQLGNFFRRLRSTGFFERGVLLITGDHRAMTPMRAEEIRLHGPRALSRVPFVVVGKTSLPKGKQVVMAQQADLSNSIAAMVGGEACRSIERGRFLTMQVEAPAYVVHVRGDRRSWLNVYAEQRDGIVALDGDATAWLGEAPPEAAKMVGEINRERIKLGESNRDAVEYLIDLRLGRRPF